MVDKDARRALLEAEVLRLEGLLEDLNGDWKKVPKLLWGTLLGIPVGVAFHAIWGVVTVALALGLWATAYYLIRVRRDDYRYEIADTKRELRALSK